ncbi:MAG: thiolase domain-containing protein [Cenarchaeum sp. SB0665_bin_23]|nr:thiolase domain-containing protein [Cenarchaeum sp. SB0667_bin_13]MXY37768.1 thiolase domain-containing protein [Cenarchaeum sp. SB0664_bin_35]MXY61338.1 thiolase domain-containing protein [Cenarchaeum sp. SB0665_bin_23]MXZ92899.1 thiolase domain-containing protein [Cenarchaeum sp. SB0666_bin_15]MYB47594.1 thiolase domain-containing protein [Cenarchaeum sp. SB0662_bin_33]MYC79410.1 thiolase domain-containing protein [Cenarchaeum sp. SB0661_bin_35]MYD58638.1 thiolase domain-containing prote
MESVCVLGAGSTKYGRLDDSIVDITVQASADAIDSAGIEPGDIKAGYISNVFGIADKQVHLGPVIMSNLGISDKPSLSIESACGSGSVSFREAYANVAAGFYDCLLVAGTEKVTHTGTEWTTTYFAYCSDFFHEGSAGVSFPGLFASMARAYLTEFDATEEDFAQVAVKNHNNGILNPKAHLRKKITIDDVMSSAVVASPLKLYDCCPFSDGASAVILCTEEFAKKVGGDYIRVTGSGRGGSPAALQGREHITTIPSTVLASKAAYKMAGITAKDVDFAEVHDCFTIAEVVDTEDLGFFEKGKGVEAVREGKTTLNSDISINPSGGLKSKGHPIGATGVGQVVEVYDQLTDQAGPRTVNDAHIGITHNFGATGASCAVHVFESV